MYKIFVDEKPIILTTIIEKETHFKNYLLVDANISKIIKKIKSDKYTEIRLIHNKENELLPLFLKLLPNVIAGGGKVYNTTNDILFIYRNDKWDLPKGKADFGESIETTAIREVEEETGVNNLKITAPLPTTYHIFNRNNTYKLKITYWFKMTTTFSGKLLPQHEEDITEVAWLNPNQVENALKNSYENIKLLFEKE